MSNQAIVRVGISSDAVAPSLARHLPTAARVLVGIPFLVFGLDGFLHFVPQPAPGSVPEGAMELAFAFVKSGYLFQLVKGTEVVAAALLLSNRFVPLALALLAPVLVNIVAFQAFLAPSGIWVGLVLLALTAYLAWSYRAAYRPMLAARVTPGRA
jgi:hypothetical protein